MLFSTCLAASAFYPGDAPASMWPNQAKQLERQLRSNVLATRVKAVQSLAETSPSLARPGIVLALADSDAEVRKLAATIALTFRYRGLGGEIMDWLSSRDPEERRLAVHLIGMDLNSEQLAQVGALVADPDKNVRLSVATTLAKVPTSLSVQATSYLISSLDDSEPRVRFEVAASLGKIGDSSAALAVAAHLQDLEPDVRVQLILALGSLENDAVVPSLLIALADPDEAVAAAAAQSLGQLGAESAVPGLAAVLQNTPFKEPGRRAAEALARLGSESATAELVRLLDRADARDFIVDVLERTGRAEPSILKGCLLGAVGPELLSCVELHEAFSGGPEVRLQMVDEGRLSLSLALSKVSNFPERKLTILALEKLAGNDAQERTLALNFLEQADQLPQEAARPVREALAQVAWPVSDTIRLLRVLANCKNAGLVSELSPFLESTYPAIRGAAARALVAQGLDGERLSELLLDVRPEVVEGIVAGLQRVQTVSQAQVVIDLLVRGDSGRRALLQSTLLALPEKLSPNQVESLFQLLARAQGGERDALLSGFLRNGDVARLVNVARQGSRADRLKIAQLSFYHPQGGQLATELMEEADARVLSLAMLALGLRGDANSVALVAKFTGPQRGRPRYVQAAALQSLKWFHQRSFKVPREVLTMSNCTSSHTALQVRSIELAAALRHPCPGTQLDDLLRNSPKPWVREAAARNMRGDAKFAQALKRCSTYETRSEIADICRFPDNRERNIGSDFVLPFEEIEVRTPYEAEATPLLPTAVLVSGEPVVFVSDRRGRLFVPVGGGQAADAVWVY